MAADGRLAVGLFEASLLMQLRSRQSRIYISLTTGDEWFITCSTTVVRSSIGLLFGLAYNRSARFTMTSVRRHIAAAAGSGSRCAPDIGRYTAGHTGLLIISISTRPDHYESMQCGRRHQHCGVMRCSQVICRSLPVYLPRSQTRRSSGVTAGNSPVFERFLDFRFFGGFQVSTSGESGEGAVRRPDTNLRPRSTCRTITEWYLLNYSQQYFMTTLLTSYCVYG